MVFQLMYGISYLTSKVKDLISAIDNRIVMAEDSCLTYPYILGCEKIVISSAANYVYRQRADSIIKSVPNKELEYNRLSLAFSHLRRAFSKKSEQYRLEKQLKFYFYSLLIVRSGAIFSSRKNDYYIPFTNLNNGNRVIIYSTGAFGQLIYRSLIHNSEYEIIGWLDEDYDESKKEGLNLIREDELLDHDFDSIIIASIDPEFNKNANENLLSIGVKSDQISLLDFDEEKLESAIESVGFNLSDYSFNEQSI